MKNSSTIFFRHRFYDKHNCTRLRKVEPQDTEERKIETNLRKKEKDFENKMTKKEETITNETDIRSERNPPLVENRNQLLNTQQNNLWKLIKKEVIDPFNQSQYKKEIIFCLVVFVIIFLISKVS